MTVATPALGRDIRVLGLIGGGHFLSHFYQLALPPLILVWRAEFGTSYAELGLIVTLFAFATGLAQIPAGILVDRLGAQPMLVGGLVVVGGSIAAMSLAPTVGVIYVLAAVAGIGNSVFHPADYAILNSSIAAGHMGKAFSLHTFSGHLGGAVAPATIIFLTAAFDWRLAMLATGLVAIAAAALVLAQGGILIDENQDGEENPGTEAGEEARPNIMSLIISKAMLLFFLFFVFAALTSSGVTSFSVVALVDIHGVSKTGASGALSAFLFASAIGILLGGAIADRYGRHDETAIAAFLISGALFLAATMAGIGITMIIGLFTLAGLAQGILRPARDMMVRAMAPKGTMGRVFGYVSTGIALGSAVAPVLFGFLVDQGFSVWIFWLLVIFSAAGIGIVLVQKQDS